MANYQEYTKLFSTYNKGECLFATNNDNPILLPRLGKRPTFCDNATAKDRVEMLLMSNHINGPWEYINGGCISKMYLAGGAVARCFRDDFKAQTSQGFDLDIYFISSDVQTTKLHATAFMNNLFSKIGVLSESNEIRGYCIFYGKSAMCEVHSPYLNNVIQLIPIKSDSNKPDFLSTFDFSYVQLCYNDKDGFIFTPACHEAYRSCTTIPNPLAKRIHAYRYVKASLQGWDIHHPSCSQNFISNYNTCDYHDMAVQYSKDCKVWTSKNFDIVEMACDPTIIANLKRKTYKINPDYYLTDSHESVKKDYQSVFDDVEVYTIIGQVNIPMKFKHPLNKHKSNNVLT